MPGNKDYYVVLGVTSDASEEEIRKAYRKLAHEHHPDRSGGNEAKFKEINEAYQTLSDKQRRQQYDMMRQFGASGGYVPRGGSPFGGFGGDFESPSGFGSGGLGGLDDLLQQLFGGVASQTRTRRGFSGFGGFASPRQSVNYTYQGSHGMRVSIEIDNIANLTPKMKKLMDEFAKNFFDQAGK
jgi:DnaJ-class molecular chaperone